MTIGLCSILTESTDAGTRAGRKPTASQPAKKKTVTPPRAALRKQQPPLAKARQIRPKVAKSAVQPLKGRPPALVRNGTKQSQKPAGSKMSAVLKGAADRDGVHKSTRNRKQRKEDDADREVDLRNWGRQLGVPDASVQNRIDEVNKQKNDPLLPLRVREAKLKMIQEGMKLPDNISGNPVDVLDDAGKAAKLGVEDAIRDEKFWESRKKHGVGAAITDELVKNKTIPRGVVDPTDKLKPGQSPGLSLPDLLDGKASLEEVGADTNDLKVWKGLKDVTDLQRDKRKKGVDSIPGQFGKSPGRTPTGTGTGDSTPPGNGQSGTTPGTDANDSGSGSPGNDSNSGSGQGDGSDDDNSDPGSNYPEDGTGLDGGSADDGADNTPDNSDSGDSGGSDPGTNDPGTNDPGTNDPGTNDPGTDSGGGEPPPDGLVFDEDDSTPDPPKSDGFEPAPGGHGDDHDDGSGDSGSDDSGSGDGDSGDGDSGDSDSDDSDSANGHAVDPDSVPDDDDDESDAPPDDADVGFTPSEDERRPIPTDPATNAALRRALRDRVFGRNGNNSTPTDDYTSGSGKGDALTSERVKKIRTKVDWVGNPGEARAEKPKANLGSHPGFGPNQDQIMPNPDSDAPQQSGNSGAPIVNQTDTLGDDGSGQHQPGGSGGGPAASSSNQGQSGSSNGTSQVAARRANRAGSSSGVDRFLKLLGDKRPVAPASK